MKPSTFILPRTKSNAAEPAGLPSDGSGRIAELAAHKVRLERALAQTRKERSEGRIIRGAEGALASIDTSVSSVPDAGPAGTLRVRVVGLLGESKKAGIRAPLEGVSVRVLAEKTVVTEAKTDPLGLAALALADEKPVQGEIQVVGVDGSTLVSDSLKAREQQPVRLYELAPSNALAGAFDKARLWAAERNAAVVRLDGLRKQVEKALASQEEELKALIGEAAADLDACDCDSKKAISLKQDRARAVPTDRRPPPSSPKKGESGRKKKA